MAAVLGGPVALWALLHAPPLLLHTLTEYCTFIALLGSMYAITGVLSALRFHHGVESRVGLVAVGFMMALQRVCTQSALQQCVMETARVCSSVWCS